jgi:TRAP-type C4-dicarboxylate transport system substrate-binding protein
VTTIANKQYEAIKYASLTHHQFTSGMISVSKSWYDGLPQSLKDVLDQATKATTPDERAGDAAGLADTLTKYKAKGIEVVTPDREAFRTIAEKVQKGFYSQYGKDQFDAIRSQA